MPNIKTKPNAPIPRPFTREIAEAMEEFSLSKEYSLQLFFSTSSLDVSPTQIVDYKKESASQPMELRTESFSTPAAISDTKHVTKEGSRRFMRK